MRKITFDIETTNFFSEVGSNDPSKLDISVVCIHDSESDEYSSYFQEDFKKLWPILEKADMLIGYNSEHFDIPLLNKYYSGDLAKIRSLDLMKEIKNSLGRRLKLDSVAEITLGKNKIGHGADAVAWWRKGEKDKVVKYCIEDVRITKELYEYALKNGHLKFRDGEKIKEIKLDTKNWERNEENALTYTLPF
jgi:DEAD/DEAH box helicase domain-containing protein